MEVPFCSNFLEKAPREDKGRRHVFGTMVHDIDLARHIFGSNPKVEDVIIAKLGFKDGLAPLISSSIENHRILKGHI